MFDAGDRSWGWLPEGRSTGSREVAGRGSPDGRGMFEDESMASTAAVSAVNVAVHARSEAAVGSSSMLAQGLGLSLLDNFQVLGSRCGWTGRLDVTARPLLERRTVRRSGDAYTTKECSGPQTRPSPTFLPAPHSLTTSTSTFAPPRDVCLSHCRTHHGRIAFATLPRSTRRERDRRNVRGPPASTHRPHLPHRWTNTTTPAILYSAVASHVMEASLLPTTEHVRPETPGLKSRSTSITPPPSSQLTHPAAVRTPSPPTPQLTSPPPTSKLSNTTALVESAAAVLYSHDQVNNASAEELRSMVDNLTNALRDMRLSAAHYKLQHNMAVMESQESASRMAVELAMVQRELDVLQQAEKRRQAAAPPEPSYAESANAANAIIMAEMNRQNQVLQAENEQLRDLFEQQKRLTEHREGEIISLIDENDRLKTRIRKNRDHMAPFLDQMNEHGSPRSNFGTPHQPTPRRLQRTPLSNENIRGPNNFEALLLADKMLSQEIATAPTTPRTAHAPRSRGHHRGAQSMSSLPNTPNRRSHPYARPPRTPQSYMPAPVPQSAPPAHYQQKPAPERRQSSNSTITASSIDEEEAFTDREDDHINESQASQMATSMLRRAPPPKAMQAPPSSNLVQSKIFGHVKKGHSSTRPKEFEKRRPESAGHQGSPRGRAEHGVGLGIGGLRE